MKSWLGRIAVVLAALEIRSGLAEEPLSASNAPCAAAGSVNAAAGSACADLSAVEDCDCLPPWRVRANIIWLHRSKPNEGALVTDFTPGGVVLLDASEFKFKYEAGPELSIFRQIDDAWSVEGRFFRVDGWNATRGTVPAFGSEVQYETTFGNAFIPANISGSYRSQLSNGEINGRRKIDDFWSVLVGFRYLDLDESGLTIQQDIGPGFITAINNIRAVNHLFGFQVGADMNLWSRGAWGVEGLVKFGVYGDSATNRVHIGAAQSPVTFDSTASANQAAFVGEFGITGVYRLNKSLSLRGGYQFLWLAGVAQASDQVAASNPLAGTATVSFTGNPSYDGAFVGLEVAR